MNNKNFSKPLRVSFFLIFNLLAIFAILFFVTIENQTRYRKNIIFLKNNIKRLYSKNFNNQQNKIQTQSIFNDIQIIEKDNYFIIKCILVEKKENYYALINQINEKIREIEDKCQIHSITHKDTVEIEIGPIIDKNNIKIIVEIVENIYN